MGLVERLLGRPSTYDAWCLAADKLAGKDIEAARSAYSAALALQHGKRALAGRAKCHQDLGKHKHALADLDQALELDPRDWQLRTERAISLNELGRFDDALAACNAAIRDNKDYAPAW